MQTFNLNCMERKQAQIKPSNKNKWKKKSTTVLWALKPRKEY